ncbi:MAG: helix-turn-helix domain-containing protein [Oscillospiraceae bacterium]
MELFEYIDLLHQPYDIFYTDSVNSPLHWHYYSEILYIVSGSIRIVCNNKEKILYKGDTCYFYPLQLHEVTEHSECTEKVRYAVVKFNIHTINIPESYLQRIYDCFVRRTAEDDFCLVLPNDETDATIAEYIQNIVSEYENKREMYMFAVQSLIHSLLITIARKSNKTKSVHYEKHTDLDLSFYHILEYIDTHSAEPLEVRQLADMCHMSYSNFARLFRENYGRSCKEYIHYIRLNKAQDLLLNSDFDLDYIAQETGFFDCSHFIRTYKKWRGITPKQERIKHKENI